MKELESNVIDAAIAQYTNPPTDGSVMLTALEIAVGALLAERAHLSDVCTCPRDEKAYCAARECRGGDDVPQWVARTWADVRQGDIIRPPNAAAYRAVVTALGPVNHWHAAPDANAYVPNESPLEWSAIPVTLQPEQGPPYTPEHGMRPGAGVEILMTPTELRAVELLGGWSERVVVREKDLDKVDDESNVD
jgi:hypothetical protein